MIKNERMAGSPPSLSGADVNILVGEDQIVNVLLGSLRDPFDVHVAPPFSMLLFYARGPAKMPNRFRAVDKPARFG